MVSLLLVVGGACAVLMTACGDTSEEPVLTPGAGVTAGAIHNELLGSIFATLERGTTKDAVAAGDGELDAVYRAQKRIAEKYDVSPLTREDVSYYIRKGQEYTTMDPVMLAARVLDREDARWFAVFMMTAKPTNARAVYDSLCAADGAPEPGSTLECMVDIAVCSSEFWLKTRRNDAIMSQRVPDWASGIDGVNGVDAAEMMRRPWWQRVLRFTTVVGVDAVAGVLVGAGSGGNVVGGAIVGGLASYGADCLLWGHE